MRTIRSVTELVLVCLTAAACATAGTPAAAQPTGARAAQDTLPIGLGTLKQDEVTIALRNEALLIKVTPLAESVTRLLAPDTYTRLHGLAASKRSDAARNTMGDVELFLVSFFSYQPNVTFQPEDLQLLHQGRLLRPVAILPVTSGWGRLLLQQQESQTAVYVFAEAIEYDQPITVRYGLEESDLWRTLLDKVRAEKNRVLSRGK